MTVITVRSYTLDTYSDDIMFKQVMTDEGVTSFLNEWEHMYSVTVKVSLIMWVHHLSADHSANPP